MKVVINAQFGGFSISLACAKYMAKRGHLQAKAEIAEYEKKNKWLTYYKKHGVWQDEVPKDSIPFLEISAKYDSKEKFFGYGCGEGFDGGYKRDDKLLVEAVEKLGKKANGSCATLKVVKIPNNISWKISEYDGYESVEEEHRSWG